MRATAPYDEIRSLLREESADDPVVREQVQAIIAAVRQGGDEAVLEYTARFDDCRSDTLVGLRYGPERFAAAAQRLEKGLLASLTRAAANIRAFHEKQLDRGFLDILSDGSLLGQRVQGLDRVGIYVPGGRAAYPSSVLMNAIPARVAGVREIVMCCPTPGGQIEDAVLVAAHIAGVDELYAIGGAQAVAALAYGTETITPVDKIVGPGNKWVAEGKRQVFGRVDIDMVAGPSEILIIADASADPRHVAADLIGQAEHDPDAIAWMVTTAPDLSDRVVHEIEALLARNPRSEVAREALEKNGMLIFVDDLAAAAEVANLRAPEHLEILVDEPMSVAGAIRHAGAIFLGHHTPEPLGDYFAGPNHVLPTGGTARWASPLGTYEFLKRTSLIGYSQERLRAHADDVIRLAESEGLPGHAETIRVRINRVSGQEV